MNTNTSIDAQTHSLAGQHGLEQDVMRGPVVLHITRLERDYFEAAANFWNFALYDGDDEKSE